MATPGPRPRFQYRLKVPVSAAMRHALDELVERHDRTLSEEVREAYDHHVADPAGPAEAWPELTAPGRAQVNVMVRPHVAAALAERAQQYGWTTTAEARIALQRHLVAHGAVPHEQAATLLTDTA